VSLACANCGTTANSEDVYCGGCGQPVKVHAASAARSTPASAGRQAQGQWWAASGDVPKPRTARNGGWNGGTAHATTSPRPRSAPSESGVAAADPQSYITADDRRMGFEALGVKGSLDPLSNSRFFWQLARRFALYFAVASIIDIALTVLALIATLMTSGLGGLANGGGGIFSTVTIIDLLIEVALMGMFLFMPVPALLGQWSRVLSFQAPAAGSALQYVQQALDRHATPRDTLGMRVLSPPGHGRHEYLELRSGYFAGYVSCFAHGHDLYAGWTFWLYISPVRLFMVRMGRRFQNYTGRGNDVFQTLRYEPARATIAALHTCTLEGVDNATGGSSRGDGSN
jgi:hypothetical protein